MIFVSLDEPCIPYCVSYRTQIQIQDASNFFRLECVFDIPCQVEDLQFCGPLGPEPELFLRQASFDVFIYAIEKDSFISFITQSGT